MKRTNGRSASNLLGYTLLIAAAVHGAIILGIGFAPEDVRNKPQHSQSLKVVLVQPPEKPVETPEKPDLLAQANSKASGTLKERDVPTLPPPIPAASPEPTPEPTPPQPPAPQPEPAPAPQPEPTVAEKPPAKPKLTARRSEKKAPATKPKPMEKKTPPAPVVKKPEPAIAHPFSAAQLLASRNEEIARLTTELERKSNAYSKRLRRKAISASTKEYKYAAYLEAWRMKVENIGNLNYPDEARRKKLYGNLMLHVAVRSDGSVENVRVLHSSGHKVLDDAAIRIVRLAAPFARFPSNIRKETDVLDITRTWQFLSNNRLGWK